MGGSDLSLMSGMVDKGWLGRKSRQGFYTYAGKKGKTLGPDVRAYLADFTEGRVSALGETEIQDRIAARLVWPRASRTRSSGTRGTATSGWC